MHGGRAPQVKAAARRRLEREQLDGDLADLLAEFELDARAMNPVDVLREQLNVARAMAHVLRLIVGQLESPASERIRSPEVWHTAGLFGLDHLGDGAPHVAVEMLGQWADRAAKLSEVAIKLGLEERRTQLSEEQGRQLGWFLRATAAVQTAGVLAMIEAAGHVDLADQVRAWSATELPSLISAEVRRVQAKAIEATSTSRPSS